MFALKTVLILARLICTAVCNVQVCLSHTLSMSVAPTMVDTLKFKFLEARSGEHSFIPNTLLYFVLALWKTVCLISQRPD